MNLVASGALPQRIAIVVLGPGSAALGRRLQQALPGARLHGPRARAGDYDEVYQSAGAHIAGLFAAGRPIVGICAAGILIRSVAPLLAAKADEPPLVAAAADGSAAVPLLGGHRGGNAIARAIAAATGGIAAVTTAGDLSLGIALDEPPPGWRMANPTRAKPVAAALLAGEPAMLIEEAGGGDWLRAGAITWVDAAALRILVTDRVPALGTEALIYHPPVLALGIGCERGCEAGEIIDLARDSLGTAGLSESAIATVVSVDAKRAEPAIHALAREFGVQARFFPARRLLAETERLTERSPAAFRAVGCWGVAEGAALAAAGTRGTLVVAKRKSRRATCAIARAAQPLEARTVGSGRGRLAIIGIGPGDPAARTPEADIALAGCDDIVGYRLYLDLLGPAIAGKRRHQSALGEERARVRRALDLAAEGRDVALVSSGDAGIYGLAALVFELVDRAPEPLWRTVEIAVCPGVSAMQVAAARAGAPLGHDFCAISLSDLLTPWAVIRNRLEAAAAAEFVVALYNPRSARRSGRLAEAAELLLRHRPPPTPVFIARNLGRAGESTRILELGGLAAAAGEIDMLSLVIVGSSTTRVIPGDPPRLYTPRGYFPAAPT